MSTLRIYRTEYDDVDIDDHCPGCRLSLYNFCMITAQVLCSEDEVVGNINSNGRFVSPDMDEDNRPMFCRYHCSECGEEILNLEDVELEN